MEPVGRMQAAVVHGPGDLRLEEVPIPDPPIGSILVRVQSCGICGTDKRIYRQGDHRAMYPVIIGHEVAGVVAKVAPGVRGVREGDPVCVAPGHGCGQCRMCHSGHPNVCTNPMPSMGYRVNGGFAEYLAVPENIFLLGFVNPIPATLTFDQAAMSEILACCLNGQRNAPVEKGDTVLVIGAGPAGIIHSQLARLRGASKVILTQRSKDRLQSARQRFPIDRIVASSEEDLVQVVKQETGGEGADVIYVCAPSGEAQAVALQLVANRGRICLFGGLPPQDHTISLDANALHYREFFLTGASSSLPENNRQALQLLADRKIDPDLLISHRFTLQDIHAAFDVVESRQCIKVIVNP